MIDLRLIEPCSARLLCLGLPSWSILLGLSGFGGVGGFTHRSMRGRP